MTSRKDKEKNYPQLRFPGFTDAWEQHKLGDYLFLPKKEKVKITNTRDLMTLKLHLKGIEAGTDRDTLSLGSTVYYKRLAGQFLYGKQNFFNGSMAIIPEKFDGKATSGDVPALDINGINSSYLYTYVSRHDYWKSKEANASGTGSKRIHETTLLKFGIMVPVNIAEQQKIGNFFEQLDHLITLHQRKLEHLQLQKKGLLQKMFPKKGEVVPELRFPGFTDAWELHKFAEIVIRVNKNSQKGGLPRIEYQDIVSGQGVLNKDAFEKRSDKKGIEFKSGDILFGKLRPYLQNWILVTFNGIAVGDWWVLHSEKSDNKFIYSLIQTSKYQIAANLSTGTKMPRSDWKVVSQTKFNVPKDKEEQKKIGDFFQQLDRLITLHQRKLEKLQELKKGYLQKMFC